MRLLADECIPVKAFHLLEQIRNPRGIVHTEMVHLLDRMNSGVGDDIWASNFAHASPPFLVITGDRGVHTKTGDPRLPQILPALGISGVFLSGKIQNAKAFDKIRALLYVWPQLEEIWARPSGERHKLLISGKGYKLKAWPM